MSEISFKGVGVALPTPFKDDYSIDYDALARLVEYTISGGVDYIVALGTTAESPVIAKEEKREICEVIKTINAGRVPLVMGIGSNDTSKVVHRIKNENLDGFSAILSVTPYYNKPSQEGLYLHFKTIAEISPIPIILYNVPGRTGVNMLAETTLQLARDFKNIIAIKEASGKINQIEEIVKKSPDGFEVMSGDDGMTFEAMGKGAVGVISVAANCYPRKIKKLYDLCSKKETQKACEENNFLKEFFCLIFKDGNPAGIKCALSNIGLINNILRLPLTKVCDNTEKEIKNYLSLHSDI